MPRTRTAEARLTIHQGTQAPHMVQNIAALHLGLEERQVRIVCKDVGGSFGIKVHIYADEMATYALSKLLKRPVKFVADRIESFNTDIHARDHRSTGKIGVNIGVAAPMAYFPFSGWRDSFLGVLHGQGRDAVEFYTDKKVVVERWPKEWSRKF